MYFSNIYDLISAMPSTALDVRSIIYFIMKIELYVVVYAD